MDQALPPDGTDTARDLVSPFQGNPGWVIPSGKGDGHLLISKRGRVRTIELNGEAIGEIPAPNADEPWIEVAFENEGHALVVASRFGPRPSRRGNGPIAGMEVFADGINLHDGRGLDEWRADRKTIDPLAVWLGVRLPPSRAIWPFWLGLACLLVLPALADGRPRLAARFVLTFALAAVPYGRAFAIQQWLYARKDMRVRLRVLGNVALWIGLGGLLVAMTAISYAILPGE